MWQFSSNDIILLVGEGNFSFARAFVEKHTVCKNIWATCYESADGIISSAKEHIAFLQQKENVTVLFQVNARALAQEPRLKDICFTHIIFNFPHVGGKMRIDLNRQLLKEFFESASTKVTVSPPGLVFVTLANGQGGTPRDSSRRLHGNSWQATSLAPYGSFALVDVKAFACKEYPGYSCVGYRSLDKGFNLGGSLIHIFKYWPLPRPSYSNRFNLMLENTEYSCPNYVAAINVTSAVDDLMVLFSKAIVVQASKKSLKCELIDNSSLVALVGNSHHVLLRGTADDCANLRNCILESPVLEDMMNSTADVVVAYGKVVRVPDSNFCLPLVGAEVVVFSRNEENALQLFLSAFTDLFNSAHQIDVKQSADSSIKYEKCIAVLCVGDQVLGRIVKFADTSCCAAVADVMKLGSAMLKFVENPRQLLARGNSILYDTEAAEMKVAFVSMHPPSFTFDISFWENDCFHDESFIEFLWNWGGDIILDVALIDEYVCRATDRKSRCFRICYQSFEYPLTLEKCIELHKNLGKDMENVFGVSVR